jgi:hypothetical protein
MFQNDLFLEHSKPGNRSYWTEGFKAYLLRVIGTGYGHTWLSYCRQRGEIRTRARTASKVDPSSWLCKKLGRVTLLEPDGKQTPLRFSDEIRIGSLAEAVGAR